MSAEDQKYETNISSCISSSLLLYLLKQTTKAEEIWAFYFGPLGDLFTEFCFNFFLGFAPGPLGNCEDVNECVEYGHQCAFRCHNIPGKVERILKGNLVSIPSPSVKIQIQVCFIKLKTFKFKVSAF